MKTAVELLEDEINKVLLHLPLEREGLKRLIQQAKEMEEKQIRKAYSTGYNESSWGRFSDSEKYYNETFKP